MNAWEEVLPAVGAVLGMELAAEDEPLGGCAALRLRIRDTTSGEVLLLRQRPPYLSHHEYELTVGAQQLAAARALAPRVKSSPQGGLTIRASGDSWSVSGWVDGLLAAPGDMPLLYASLADVHEALKPKVAKMSWDLPRQRWLACPDTGVELGQMSRRIDLASGFLRRIEDIARRAASMPSPTQTGVIHGDASLDNVVVAAGRPIWVDFDNSRLSLLASDITQLVARSVVVPALSAREPVDFAAMVDHTDFITRNLYPGGREALGVQDAEHLVGLLAVALTVAAISETNLDDPDLVSHPHAHALLEGTLDSIENSLRG